MHRAKKPKILAESVSTFSLSTVPRGAAIVIVEGNSLDTSPAGAHRRGNRSP